MTVPPKVHKLRGDRAWCGWVPSYGVRMQSTEDDANVTCKNCVRKMARYKEAHR